MNKEEANKTLSEKLAEVKKILGECYEIANQFGLDFHTPISHWGMGGNYHGRGRGEFERKEDTDEVEGDWYYSNEGWVSSSENC